MGAVRRIIMGGGRKFVDNRISNALTYMLYHYPNTVGSASPPHTLDIPGKNANWRYIATGSSYEDLPARNIPKLFSAYPSAVGLNAVSLYPQPTSAYYFGTINKTYELAFYMTNSIENYQYNDQINIFQAGNTGDQHTIIVFYDYPRKKIRIRYNPGGSEIEIDLEISLNAWHRLAIELFDNGTHCIYLDGKMVVNRGLTPNTYGPYLCYLAGNLSTFGVYSEFLIYEGNLFGGTNYIPTTTYYELV